MTPPSETLEYVVPTACAARSVHSRAGVFSTRLVPRVLKLEPDAGRMLKFPPLNPPREPSYGDVVSDVEIAASRGRLFPPNCMPLSVVLFCSAPTPSTEKPSGWPSRPG